MIAIIDYDAGNIKSVEKAVSYLGGTVTVSRDRDEIMAADKVILPGVGNFGDAVKNLKRYNLINTIIDIADKNIPFLGICLGLQLLFENSEESEGVAGLGILKGDILKIPSGGGIKIPHIGWNSLKTVNSGRLFSGMEEEPYVYFVHSYYLKAKDESIVKAVTDYGVQIHASVEAGNIFACQFHPEKSGRVGLKLLDNFLSLS